MNDHIVIINAPKFNPDLYFHRLISQVRSNPATKKTPIVLLNNLYLDGLKWLNNPGQLNGVKYPQ